MHPFSSSPDDRFYYDSPQHSKAIVKLTHAAQTMVGLAILLGDIGTGKTTLSRILLDNLTSSDEFEVALLVMIHSEITPIWLLKKIGNQFGVELAGLESDVGHSAEGTAMVTRAHRGDFDVDRRDLLCDSPGIAGGFPHPDAQGVELQLVAVDAVTVGHFTSRALSMAASNESIEALT